MASRLSTIITGMGVTVSVGRRVGVSVGSGVSVGGFVAVLVLVEVLPGVMVYVGMETAEAEQAARSRLMDKMQGRILLADMPPIIA